MQDKRLGQIGGIDTKVCAVSEKEVSAGMIRFSLGNGWYFRVHPRFQRDVTDEFKDTMKALVPTARKSKSTKQTGEEQVEQHDN